MKALPDFFSKKLKFLSFIAINDLKYLVYCNKIETKKNGSHSRYIPCIRKTAVRHQSCQWIKAASTMLSIAKGDLKCIDLKNAKDVIDFFFGEALS